MDDALRPHIKSVKVDPVIRVVVPRDLAAELKIKAGDRMQVFTDGRDVVYRKVCVGA